MKKCFRILFGLVLAVTLTACSMTTSMLEDEVLELFNEKAEDYDFYATEVALVHVEGNVYEGLITIVEEGEEVNYGIEVLYDGRNFTYEVLNWY